ncbi:MAG: hypothetical protein IJF21_01670 [Clostridia bacterium]|nr:hypothetical protein [Clostridia bacterium]
MNTKNLIVAFITVSVAALVVSAFAVFAVARSRYEAMLTSATEAEDIRTEEPTRSPETTAAPETSALPEETSEMTESETLPQQTEAPEESTMEVTTDVEETTEAPSGYTLKLDGDRLIVNAPDGTSVCERIIYTSSLHPKDREALISGILFSDERSAMSAIYDIIS